MRIFIPIFDFGKSGGFRVLSNLANEWIKLGHQVNFICILSENSNSIPYYPTDAKIIYFELIPKSNNKYIKFKIKKLIRFRQIISLIYAINKFTNTEDIILANYSLTAYSVFFSKKNNHKFYYIQAYEPEFFDNSLKGILFSLNQLLRVPV
jgi:hypothetical protein